MGPLKRALDMARPAFSTILKTLKPDLVIYDFLQPWAPEKAAAQNIPAVVFLSTGAAASSLIMHDWFEPRSEYPFSQSIYFRENEYSIRSRLVKSTGTDTNDHIRVRDCVRKSNDVVLIKTFRELEGKYIDFLSELTRKKIVPVGPLVQNNNNNNDNNNEKSDLIEWLDRKDRRSTIFASFGSEYFLSENEIEQIACGLELSGVNFVWALRFPTGENINIHEKLPLGFLERVGERGMVVEGWAPQQRILSHLSVGGFLSHCGWSSVMEGLYWGVPIVAAPMNLDQPLNARLVEEVGVGEEVVRSREGEIDRGEVARVVRNVVAGEAVEVLRRVAEMSERMREKGEEEIDGVVEELVRLCNKEERLMNKIESEGSMKRLNNVMMVVENRERVLSENT
ncbi:hypothetical protein DH2020_034398 [Rehmannia glutinosa]|uniref:Glycosyltransferase n=1 Tax=Rehmannia glutinosa TaxID=99300 RepID=A0ABR0V9H7_REHGL